MCVGGGFISICSKYASPERAREVGSNWEGDGEREIVVGYGWGRDGMDGGRECVVLFTIHPFLFYIVPKKNKRTNTFLNKGNGS